MSQRVSHVHFHGKEAIEHVIEARLKGREASNEIHGTELPGHYSAAADAAKETSFLLIALWILFQELEIPLALDHTFLIAFTAGWLVWKVGRSAILGWSRLERLHRVIEEERWEIEHHRAQEREELKALYAAKGFEGKLLDEVTDVLMADDNRLLKIMLEEELGLKLESHEHPLKQASGAAIGVIGAVAVIAFGFYFLPAWGAFLAGAIVIALSAGTSAQMEKNRPLPAIVWNLAVGALAAGVAYFAAQLISR
ncbi:MAG: VIT1/CCC1 transporter family protein [Verrucomicrobia bacterium]|nr:VIT1/CCC1 transporter family protein [Verrucomicrobiota bacterium]